MPSRLRGKRRFTVRRSLLAGAVAGVLVPGVGLAAAVPASAATLPPKYAAFAHCPVNVKHVTVCLSSTVSSGSFALGSTTLAITQPITINVGLIPQPDGSLTSVAPTDGTPALLAQPISVPILGIPGLVSATPALLGSPSVNLLALETGSGPALSLPLDVKLNNLLLGSSCTIGNAANPISINLTTGTTNPPQPNQPITGSPGRGHVDQHGVVTVTGTSLVDNAFAVPGAYGCGLFGILDPLIDGVEGLPSAAGLNTAIMNATSAFAPASLIKRYLG